MLYRSSVNAGGGVEANLEFEVETHAELGKRGRSTKVTPRKEKHKQQRQQLSSIEDTSHVRTTLFQANPVPMARAKASETSKSKSRVNPYSKKLLRPIQNVKMLPN